MNNAQLVYLLRQADAFIKYASSATFAPQITFLLSVRTGVAPAILEVWFHRTIFSSSGFTVVPG